MRTIGKAVLTAVCGLALALLAQPGIPAAAEPGGTGGMKHGDHAGMKVGDHGTMPSGGHDMMKMGTRVYQGLTGPWHVEVRMIDMKAQMEASGMKAQGGMANSHHIALALTDPKTRTRVPEATGTVTVIGPDRSITTYDIKGMQGHLGADVNLAKPGDYRCNAKLESGGQTGILTFRYSVK